MEKEDFGILMVTHGGLAKGYLSALKLVWILMRQI